MLGCRIEFLFEEQTEPYMQYGEESTGEENLILRQECPAEFLASPESRQGTAGMLDAC
jgi:hypothetical protein